MLFLIFLGLALASGAVGISVVLWARRRRYCRQLKYDPAQDCYSGLSGTETAIRPSGYSKNGLSLPPIDLGTSSLLLELDIRTTTWGHYVDPQIIIETHDWRETFTVERGARGKRLFNITRMIPLAKDIELKLILRERGLYWNHTHIKLHAFHNKLTTDDRIVVFAPHPDDAEIAAFGLYADTKATVVTLTAGDNSDRYTSPTQKIGTLSNAQIARTRAWESICIPQLADIPQERVINLCFPDGQLSHMRAKPSENFVCTENDRLNFDNLRRLNRSPLMRERQANKPLSCSWNTLLDDIEYILKVVQPTVIVAPHPFLDPHEDHEATTAAVVEACQRACLPTGRFFLYCSHNRRSELWPFGPAGTGSTHLPILKEDGIVGSSFYSHQLTSERQTEKFIALEAMHDVREMEWPTEYSFKTATATLRTILAWIADGLDRVPTSYLRRAVRRDEPFFVATLEETSKMLKYRM